MRAKCFALFYLIHHDVTEVRCQRRLNFSAGGRLCWGWLVWGGSGGISRVRNDHLSSQTSFCRSALQNRAESSSVPHDGQCCLHLMDCVVSRSLDLQDESSAADRRSRNRQGIKWPAGFQCGMRTFDLTSLWAHFKGVMTESGKSKRD